MEDLTGKQFGAYRIISPFGEGGMATVYKAYQPSMDRYVALKVLPRFHSSDPEFLGRFEQEAKALAQLQHPHILPVYDYGESEGYTYFVMPLMQDGNLAEQLAEERLSLERINQVISQVGSALEFAHSRGFIHRDVKPSNVLLDMSGNCMLMDFGIAKIIEGSQEFTKTGGIIGTPAYMSPEQGSGRKIDHKSDIYSLGIILYEMVAGKPPFQAETPVAVIFKHVHDPLPPPSSFNPELSEDVERVILKSLAKDPDDRYRTVREMVDALSRAVTAARYIEPTEVELPPMIRENDLYAKRAAPDLLEQEIVAEVSPEQAPPKSSESPESAPSRELVIPELRISGRAIVIGIAVVVIAIIAIFFKPGAINQSPTIVPTSAHTIAPTIVPSISPNGQTVTFWHIWGSGNTGEGLTSIVDDFNATNEWGITVEALDHGSYRYLEDAMNAAIQSGDLPDIVVGHGNVLDTWYSDDVLDDMKAFVSDPDYGLTISDSSDFYEGAWNGGLNAEGARIGFPHGQAANVMFYNYTWGEELGFAGPPATWAEFKEQTCTAAAANSEDDNPDNDGTGGFVMTTGATAFSTFVFAFGEDYVGADGVSYDFAKPGIVEVAGYLKELWDEGCAFATESYPNPEFATRKALITMSSTVGLPYQIAAFEADDAYWDDVWGFIPIPGDGTKAVGAFIQISAIVKSNPERSLAAWLFLKWFTSPEVNAKWIEASAYYPIRKSTLDFLDIYIAENPLWADGIDLVLLGDSQPAWSSWGSVHGLLGDTYSAIIQGAGDIQVLLEELNVAAAEEAAETQ